MSGSSRVKITCTGAQHQLLMAMGWLFGQNLNPFCDMWLTSIQAIKIRYFKSVLIAMTLKQESG